MMDIRELKHAAVFEGAAADAYEQVMGFADSVVSDTALVALPRNIATLAMLQVFETMIARAERRWERAMLSYAAAGVRPDSMPGYTDQIDRLLNAVRPVLRAIDLRNVAAVFPTVTTDAAFRAAGNAMAEGALAASATGFLDEATLGWRSLEVAGDVITLTHRSPERLRRRIEGALHAEAAHNAPLLQGQAGAEEQAFYEAINALQDGPNTWDWLRAPELIEGALHPARRAGQDLHKWDLPDDTEVGSPAQFTIGDFRRVVEVVHALATIADLIGDGVGSLGNSRLLRGGRERWVDLVEHHSGVAQDRVAAALAFLTRHHQDEPRGQGQGRSATISPLFDLGNDELVLSSTFAMWQDPFWSLLATWVRRAHGDFGAKTGARGHQLAEEVRGLFAARNWTTVLEHPVPTSDLDVATALPTDDFLIVVEAKAFMVDPVRQLEDPKVWTQLADNVDTVRDPQQFAITFQHQHLQLGSVVGLAVVPGFLTPVTEHTDDFGALGVEDLRALVAQSASPRDLWARIKATETAGEYPLKEAELQFGPWTLKMDIGDPAAIPGAVRARPAEDATPSLPTERIHQ